MRAKRGNLPGFLAISLAGTERRRQAISGLPFGGTDCALPMLWATGNKVEADTFVVYTDNETWAGNVHPTRRCVSTATGRGSTRGSSSWGLTATHFTIADPADPGMLDIAGFDSALPALLTDFSARAI